MQEWKQGVTPGEGNDNIGDEGKHDFEDIHLELAVSN